MQSEHNLIFIIMIGYYFSSYYALEIRCVVYVLSAIEVSSCLMDLVVMSDLSKHCLYHWHCCCECCQHAVQETCSSMVRLCQILPIPT